MTPDQIVRFILDSFDHVLTKSSWGETAFFANPGGRLPSGSYFATIKEKDGANDRASHLDRDGIFRLNIGPGKGQFEPLFGKPPSRPAKGGIIDGPWDFTVRDVLMPHPVYGWMSWVCVLNPSKATFEEIKPLLNAAHIRALDSAIKKLGRL